MQDDHLDKEVSISAELTNSGIKAKTNSRTISGFDRLLGSIGEFLSAPLEGLTAKRRLRDEAELAIMQEQKQHVIEYAKNTPEIAIRAIQNHDIQILRKQENKDAVVQAEPELSYWIISTDRFGQKQKCWK